MKQTKIRKTQANQMGRVCPALHALRLPPGAAVIAWLVSLHWPTPGIWGFFCCADKHGSVSGEVPSLCPAASVRAQTHMEFLA
jgi:hypothetical protein